MLSRPLNAYVVLIAQYSSGIVELVVWVSIDQLRWPDLVGPLCLQSD